MRRIAGVFHFDGSPADTEGLARMLAAMQTQPDGPNDIWTEDRVGLGSLDLGGKLTAGNGLTFSEFPGRSHVLAFDGRIDNKPELQKALQLDAQVGDESLILSAYCQWGPDFAVHLIGDFSIMLWDSNLQVLCCARDQMGFKPFYYFLNDQLFVCASTVQAVLAYPGVPYQINEARIADHLLDYLEGIDREVTFFKNIFRLPPAHIMLVQPEKATQNQYWELSPAALDQGLSDRELLEGFSSLLEEAVRCRSATNESACTMSGGIDSCSIAAVGREIRRRERGDPFHTISMVLDDPPLNREAAYIRDVLAQGSLQADVIHKADVSNRMDDLIGLMEKVEEPFDTTMNLLRLVYMQASKKGVKTVMDGGDGDILLGRSDHATPLWRSGQIGAALGETLWAGGVTATLESRWALLLTSLRAAFLPEWVRAARRSFNYLTTVDHAVKSTLIRRDFARQVHLPDRIKMDDAQNIRERPFNTITEHKRALESAYLTAANERYERTASASGVAACAPLMDIRLASFCLGLPWQYKTHRGWTKVILRRAVEPLLPPQVVWRKDKDQLMWHFNLLILKERRDDFYQVCRDEQAALAPYIQYDKLMACWQGYMKHFDEANAHQLWSGIALALWLRRQRNLAAQR